MTIREHRRLEDQLLKKVKAGKITKQEMERQLSVATEKLKQEAKVAEKSWERKNQFFEELIEIFEVIYYFEVDHDFMLNIENMNAAITYYEDILNKLTRCFTTFKKRNLDATEQKLARTLLGYLFNEYIEDLKLFAEMAKGSEDLEFLHDRLMSGHGDLIRGGFHEEAEQLLKASNF